MDGIMILCSIYSRNINNVCVGYIVNFDEIYIFGNIIKLDCKTTHKQYKYIFCLCDLFNINNTLKIPNNIDKLLGLECNDNNYYFKYAILY